MQKILKINKYLHIILLGGDRMQIERKEYFDKLVGYKDKKIIKVVTGVRRCGKSTLLKMFQDYL